MRSFLAVEIPSGIKQKIASIQNQMSKKIPARYVAEENLHITLKFLGEVKEIEMLDPLDDISFDPFRISLSDIGVFPNRNRIRVIWVGIKDGFDELIRLHDMVESKLPFKRDKDYHPHITIARVKSKIDGDQSILNQSMDDSFEIKRFHLYKSTLTSSGPFYQKIASYPT